jgi:hypothetical protein
MGDCGRGRVKRRRGRECDVNVEEEEEEDEGEDGGEAEWQTHWTGLLDGLHYHTTPGPASYDPWSGDAC